jgi:hypothetical protein
MKRNIFLFLFIGIITMLAGEFQINVLVLNKGVSAFLMSIGLYIALLLVAYAVGKLLERIFSEKRVDVIYYFLGALFGLALEWIVFGNSLMQNPYANQAGMFAWWGAVFLMPRIFTTREPAFEPVIRSTRRRSLWVLILYSLISTFVIIALPAEPAFLKPAFVGLLMALGYIILNFQFGAFLARKGVSKRLLRVFFVVLLILGIANFLIQ